MDRTRTAAGLPLLVLATLTVPVLHAMPALAEGVPDPRFSFCDPVVVANSSGTPIGGTPPSAPGFDVTVKDVNNAPMPGSIVKIDYSATTFRLSSVQTPGTTLDCAARRVSRVTNIAGVANFAVRGGGWANSNTVSVLIKDETEIILVKARSTDLDGLDGRTALGDLALFSANFLTNQAAQETDFDVNGTTGLGDFTILIAEFLRFEPAQTYCP